MFHKLLSSRLGIVLIVLILHATGMGAHASNDVRINGRPMSVQQQQQYLSTYGTLPLPGSYWYDKKTGLYGLMGAPAAGTIRPGHDFGPLPENASRGTTGVYINGRHLPAMELQFYASVLGQMQPGRYWMDAQGKWGPEQRQVRAPQHQQQQAQGRHGGGDRRLVGVYRGETISGGEGTALNTQLNWTFQADGTVLYGAQSHFNMNQRDYNLNQQWVAGGRTSGNTERGRWSTSGKKLTIKWDSGEVSQFRYGFEPNGSLVFRNARTGKLINFYPRIR